MSVSIHNLKDVHLPQSISFWPPAVGWFLLASLIIFIGFICAYALHHFWKKKRAKYAALKTIKQLKKQRSEETLLTLIEASKLLRRVANHYFSDDKIAGLSGKQWIRFLNESANSEIFSGPLAYSLSVSPYSTERPDNTDELLTAIECWIKKAC